MSTERERPHQKRVVALGGGTGLYYVIRGLVDLNQPELTTAIVGTWDSGGSSGRLRVEMGVLPSGDIRRVYIAAMEDERQRLVAQRLFNERFADFEGPLKGHALGNLIDSQLQRIYQGLDRGSQAFRELFRIRANIEPVSITNLELCAKTRSGQILEGEVNIDSRGDQANFDPDDRISRRYFDTIAEANPKALEAIEGAETIVFGPGSLHTSILPHLAVEGVADVIKSCSAKLIFVLNLMTVRGDTDYYKASQFLEPFLYELGDSNRLDYLITSEDSLDPEVLRVYKEQGQEPVEVDKKQYLKLAPKAKIIKAALARYDKRSHLLRHDPQILAQAILSL